MGPLSYWLRINGRRRWVSLVALTLVVALASGVVMALVAGARRGGSAWDRFSTEGNSGQALISPLAVQPDYDRVRALPYVAGLVESPFANGFISDPLMDPQPTAIFLGRGPFGTVVERAFIVKGEPFDQTKSDEAVVSESFVKQTGRGPGSTITTVVPDSSQSLSESMAAPASGAPPGQKVVVRIVGVARVPAATTAFGIDTPWVMPTQAFWAAHEKQYAAAAAGDPGGSRVGALVRLKGGEADIPRLTRDLNRIVAAQVKASGGTAPTTSQVQVIDLVTEAGPTRSTTRFERLAVLGLAIAAGLAALVVVGLLVTRRAALLTADARRLADVGLTRRELTWAGATAVTVSGVTGAALGAALAVALSPQFPVGLSRYVEPSPGVRADPAVLLAGFLVVSGVVALLAIASARVTSARLAVDTPAARARAGRWLTSIPSLPAAIGARRAYSPRRVGGLAPPWAAPAVGVLGLVAAMTLATGLFEGTHDPHSYSPGPSANVAIGFDSQVVNPPAAVIKKLRTSTPGAPADAVQSVHLVRAATATSQGHPMAVIDIGPAGDRPDRPVIAGRLPDADDEIALGPSIARSLGLHVGDRMPLTSGQPGAKPVAMKVVGLSLGDWQGNSSYDLMSIVTRGGFEDVFGQTFDEEAELVVFKPGTDAAAWTTAWALKNGAADFTDVVAEPRAVTNLARLWTLPWVLGGFLGFLGLVALIGGLASSQRASRHTDAVLRAMGFTRRQSRAAVAWESLLVAAGALVVGVPLGFAVGRSLWRRVAREVPIAYAAPELMGKLLLVAGVVLAGALVVATVPAWRTGRLPVSELLRGE